MHAEKARKLELLLRHLVTQRTGTETQRSAEYNGVTIDSDAFRNDDAAAIEGLWLAVDLLETQLESK
jgi:hypothetical protein